MTSGAAPTARFGNAVRSARSGFSIEQRVGKPRPLLGPQQRRGKPDRFVAVDEMPGLGEVGGPEDVVR